MLFLVHPKTAAGALISPRIVLLSQMQGMMPLLEYSPEPNCLEVGALRAACMVQCCGSCFVWNHWRGRAGCTAYQGMRAICPLNMCCRRHSNDALMVLLKRCGRRPAGCP